MEKAKPTDWPNRWWFASGLALSWGFYQFFDFLYRQWWANVWRPGDPPGPMERAGALNRAGLVGLTLLAFALLGIRRCDRSRSRPRQLVILVPLLAFFALHVENWHICQHSAYVWVEDVGKTSIASDRLILRGIDPYVARVSPDRAPPGSRMDAYKYLPVTLAAYFPGAILAKDGDKAILATNMLLSALAALVLVICLARWVSLDAGLACAMFFFMSRIISCELVRLGSNDIIPMILVFLAMLNLPRRWTCGFLVGLAVSAKFLPGLLWAPICLTPRGKRRYAGGLACGLLPCLPFFIWNPMAMIRNAVVFPLTRPRETLSVLAAAPRWAQIGAELCAVGGFALFMCFAWRREMLPMKRCAYAAALTLCVQLASPIMHQNYFIWWYMPLCVSFTALIFNPATYEWISSRHIAR